MSPSGGESPSRSCRHDGRPPTRNVSWASTILENVSRSNPQFCSQRLDRDLQRLDPPRSTTERQTALCVSSPTFARAQSDIPKMWPDGCVHSTSQYGLPPSFQRACHLCVFVDASARAIVVVGRQSVPTSPVEIAPKPTMESSTPRRGGQSCEQGLASSSDWHLAIPAVPCKPMMSTLSGAASSTYFSCTEPRTRHPEKSYPGDRLGPKAQETM